jgi:hypothetical protein
VKNKISDLNNHLFAQLERLSDEDLKGEALDLEVKRADAIVAVSEQIVGAAGLTLKAAQIIADHGAIPRGASALLAGKEDDAINGTAVQ